MGYDFRIIDYYKKVKKVLNWEGNFTYNKNKPSGQKRKLLNIKNQKTLGWMPKYSLEKSIKITNEYYLKMKKVIIKFSGGFGNQLFQYSLAKHLELDKKFNIIPDFNFLEPINYTRIIFKK